MILHAVATHNPNQEFSTGIVLGVVEAINPEDAISKVADQMIDDKVAEEITSVKSKYALIKWVLENVYNNQDDKEIVVWEITAEYPEGNLQLESHQ